MKYVIKILSVAVTAAFLASCGTFGGSKPKAASDEIVAEKQGVLDVPLRLGSPFVVGTTTYIPEDVASYDDVGYASFYGRELEGRPTANGEIFMSAGISAAHKTLPMPTYAEVTSLDTGRTILVRINDRGPFANDRLIDLSEGAARQLGILEQGVAGVRVRKVNPSEQERAVLRQGLAAAQRIDTPESLLRVLRDKLAKLPSPKTTVQNPSSAPSRSPGGIAPDPAKPGQGRFIREGTRKSTDSPAAKPSIAAQSPVTSSVLKGAGYFVQVGAFSSRQSADILARKLDAKVNAGADGKLFRVQYGPYVNEQQAQSALDKARKAGYPQARLLRQ